MLCFQLVEENLSNANIDPKESNHLPVTNERAVDETDRVKERQNLEKRSRKQQEKKRENLQLTRKQ